MKRRDFFAAAAAGALALTLPGHPAGRGVLAELRHRITRGRQPDPRFAEVAARVEQLMREIGVPGVALGIFADGSSTTRGFGVTSIADPLPVTDTTVFPLASISKTVAATAIMRLAEQGRVQLDAPVQRYIPDFRTADADASRRITVQHLLTHSPGFEGQLTAPDRGLASLQAFAVETVRNLPSIAEPGTLWGYNNAAYTILGHLIEVVHGRDIHRALNELVFAPLRMERSFTRMGDVVTHRFAQGHRGAVGNVSLIRPFALSSSVTAGGVAMSVQDLLSYAAFHLGASTAPGEVLSPESRTLMRTPQLPKAPTADSIGLGWQLRPVGGLLTAAHGGTAAAGHRLLVELVPERNLAFAILTNHGDGWQLVEPVERLILQRYAELALAPGQPIVHRGINEDMTNHASPLQEQPAPEQYVGTYTRPPSGSTTVRADGEALLIGGGSGTRLLFYGRDVAYSEGGSGGYRGQPYEFIRQADGSVGWIRINGRVARRE